MSSERFLIQPSPILPEISADSERFEACSQRRWVMPFVLLLNFSGPHVVKVPHEPVGKQLGVQFGNAVDRMAPDDGKISHAHFGLGPFFDERHVAQFVHVARILIRNLTQKSAVDFVNNFHVARQERFHEADRPFFERFGHERMVGIGKGLA